MFENHTEMRSKLKRSTPHSHPPWADTHKQSKVFNSLKTESWAGTRG